MPSSRGSTLLPSVFQASPSLASSVANSPCEGEGFQVTLHFLETFSPLPASLLTSYCVFVCCSAIKVLMECRGVVLLECGSLQLRLCVFSMAFSVFSGVVAPFSLRFPSLPIDTLPFTLFP